MARASVGVLGVRNFRTYWLGQLISLVGLWMQQMAAAQVIVTLTSSNLAIALIQLAASVPMILLSMRGGELADRFERRRILIYTQLGLAAIAFVYAALVGSHILHLWMVYVLGGLIGVVSAFDFPAQQALVPDLVPREQIPNAVAMNQAIFHGARLVGPALAGLVIAATSMFMAFVANGVSYFAVIVSLLVIRPAPRAPGAKRGTGKMAEGIAFIKSHPSVKALLGFTGLTTLFIFPLLIIFMSMFVKIVVHTTDKAILAKGIGAVMAMSGLGSLVGSLGLMAIPGRARGAVIFCACAVVSSLLFVITFQQRIYPLAGLVCCLSLSVSLAVGLSSSILQLLVPPELRGRVMAIYGMLWMGLVPLAGLVAGTIADVIGLRPTLRGMAIAYAICALPWLLRAGVFKLGLVPPQQPVAEQLA